MTFNLHDLDLTALKLNGDKSVLLEFEYDAGQTLRGLLINVEEFLAKDFREGNIVLSVEFFKGESTLVPDLKPYLRELQGLNQLLPKSTQEKIEQHVVKTAERIRVGETGLFLLSPSYGCEILAVCKSFEILT